MKVNKFFRKMIKDKKLMLVVVSAIIFLILHSTPHMAVRTKVFFMGYPKAAFTSPIIDDEYHNEIDKHKFATLNAKAYTLTVPPVEEATEGELRNYLVSKFGFLHFAEYYGNV